MSLLSFFQYDFLLRALLAGALVAFSTGTLGLFLVLRKMSLIGDGLAHVSFGAVALGLLLGFYPFYLSMPITLLAVFLIFHLAERAKIYGDTAIGIISSVGIAGGVIIASLANGFNVDLFSYLFGSLLAVSKGEVIFLAALALVVAAFLFFSYHSLVSLSFDNDYARSSGVPVRRLNAILLALTALSVGAAVKAVGVLLVSALLILPAASALQIAKSFKGAFIATIAFSLLGVLLGLMAAVLFNLPAGASIVVAGFVIFSFNYLFWRRAI